MAYSNTNAVPRADIASAVFEAQSNQANIPFIGLELYPILDVAARSGEYIKIELDKAEAFNADALKVAPGSGRPRVTRRFSTDTYATNSFELEELLPDETSADLGRYFDVEVASAGFLSNQLLISHEKRVADTLFGSGFTAISAAAAYTAGAADNIDLAKDVDDAMTKLAEKNVTANTVVLSLPVYNRARRSKKILEQIFGPVKVAARPASAQELAEVLGVERVLVGRAAYNSAKKGQSYAGSFLWSNSKIAVCRTSAGEFTAGGLGRTLLWREDSPVPVVAETYRDEARRSNVIRVRHNVVEKTIDASVCVQIDTSFA
jgi:hypothetical protein